MSEPARLVTAEELERFPNDDRRYELVNGRLIPMSPVSYLHGRTVVRFASLLERHVRAGRLGEVVTEVGFKLRSKPDTVRAPDVAFIRRERIPAVDPRGFWNGPPDLAVEVLSPDDTPSEIRAKTHEYVSRGVDLVVVVDPAERTVSVTGGKASAVISRGDDEIDLGSVVPGFRCRVREIFE
jgi:Uma2 family endonuclease